jgi:hypothetical protein
MIDLILLVFVGAVFYGGFKCGAKFQTLSALKAAVVSYFK